MEGLALFFILLYALFFISAGLTLLVVIIIAYEYLWGIGKKGGEINE